MSAHSPILTADTAETERVEIVRSAGRLADIGPAWTALWRELDGLAFQSHAWVAGWWSTIPDRDNRALRIGLLWRGERLAAIVPLAIVRRRGLRLLEWAAASYTDYGDILISADCTPLALQQLWRDLARSGGFDLAMLSRLLPAARARALASPNGGTGFGLKPHHRTETSFRVGGPFSTGASWLEGQSKKTRQNYRRGYKALEESGAVRFRLLGPDEDLAPLLARLGELKRKWLEKRDRQSVLFDEGAGTLGALVEALRASGVLRAFVLECAGEVVAISLNFVQHDTMMAFVTTYDPQFDRASPGMLLMIDYIGWAIDNGLALVDFLCGAEPFKLRFANQSVILDTIVAARTPLGHAALAADWLRRAYTAWRSRRAADPAARESPAEA